MTRKRGLYLSAASEISSTGRPRRIRVCDSTPASSACAAASTAALRASSSLSLARSALIGAAASPTVVYGMFQTVAIRSSVPSRRARSIAVSPAFCAVGDPSVASMTGFMSCLLRSHVATEAARELAVRLLGLGEISGALESLARLEQICGQIGPADVDAKALDEAIAFDDGAAGLPKHAPLARARLGAILSGEAERAGLGFDLAHGISLCAASRSGIGPTTDLRCGLLPKHVGLRKTTKTAPIEAVFARGKA